MISRPVPPTSWVVNDELLRTVRELTLQLRPRVLDDLGLQPALEWHIDRVRRQTGDVEVLFEGEWLV